MTTWTLETPVVLLIFNRPDTTRQVFEAIRQAQPPQLLVIADGPRPERPGEADQCAAARSIIDRVDWGCEVLTNYSGKNLGCRQRVSSGLTWAFTQVEEAIILEDDCIPHSTFFRFCEELLDYYRYEERVMVISGDNFQFGCKHTPYSYYFSRYPHCWGWATWRRAWNRYDSEMKHWSPSQATTLLMDILQNQGAVHYWSKIFESVARGFNSWAYVWTWTCWLYKGLTILPAVNLISNIGCGPEATHTKAVNPFANLPTEAIQFPLQHPPEIVPNRVADDFTELKMFSGSPPTQGKAKSDRSLIQNSLDTLNRHQNESALNLLNGLISTRKDLPSLHYGRAVALARLGHRQEAIKSLDRLISEIPQHKKARLLLKQLNSNKVENFIRQATQALNSNQIDRAFSLLNQAKSLKQPTQNLDYLRATCALRAKRVLEAREFLNEELRYFPNNTEAQTLLNRIEQAIAQHPHLTTGKIDDPEFQQMRQLVRSHTMVSEARLYSLFSFVKNVCLEDIPGNIVECGVAGGGSTALMAMVIKRYTQRPRAMYAFDSFEGMPPPTDRDKASGIPANATGWGTGTCASPEEKVRELCAKLGVADVVRTVKGYFQDTLPQTRGEIGPIALLHMDGDWYESTQTILHNCYDLVVSNGFIQVDDYGHWEGCRDAIHEFEQQRQLKFNLRPIDYSGVWFTIPSPSD